MQIAIHHTSYEIIGTRIHQTDVNAGNNGGDVYESLLFHPEFGGRFLHRLCSDDFLILVFAQQREEKEI